MKKVNNETHYNTLKEIAKELGIKFVGIKKEVIIENINKKIDELNKSEKPKKGGKWFEQENAFPYNEGEILEIINHKNAAIIGRRVQVIGPSTKRNAIKVQLICINTGSLQKTKLSLDFEIVEKVQMNYPVISNNLPMVN